MRLPAKSQLFAGAILAASLGFVNLGKAAPLAGFTSAGPAVKVTRDSLTVEATAEKAHYAHRHYYHRHYHHRYHHHYMYH